MHIDPERAPNKTDPNSVPLPAFLGHQLGEIINGKWRCALREGGRRRHVLMPPRPPQQWKMDLPLPARAALVGYLRLRGRCCGDVVPSHRYSHPITYG